jgi:hypothetical protein
MGDKRYYIIETGYDNDESPSAICCFFNDLTKAINFAEKRQLRKNYWICVSEWLDDAKSPSRLGTIYYRKEK